MVPLSGWVLLLRRWQECTGRYVEAIKISLKFRALGIERQIIEVAVIRLNFITQGADAVSILHCQVAGLVIVVITRDFIIIELRLVLINRTVPLMCLLPVKRFFVSGKLSNLIRYTSSGEGGGE